MSKLIIILFREFLEISIIVNLIAASTHVIKGSRFYIFIGLFLGGLISLIFSYFIQYISPSFNGMGEDIFNAIILLCTSLAILWTVIWIKINQNSIKDKSSDLVNKISNQNYQKIMISFIVISSVLREFVEIVLLCYGVVLSSKLETHEYIIAFVLGASGGLLFGLILYKGLQAITKKYLFKIFTILLILISASMCSEAVKILNSSGIILFLSDPLWDISHIISDTSFIAKILKLFSIGYSSSPSKIEVIFYMIPIISFLILSKKIKNSNK
jgi:high-affinity iron transporter